MIEYPLMTPDELARDAWAAVSRQDNEEALRLWGALRDHSPDRADGYVGAVYVLWSGGRYDEAEDLAQTAFARFPKHPELFVQHAWIASAREDWNEAVWRWSLVREHAPERIDGYLYGARALWQAGSTEAAEAVAAAGQQRDPRNIELVVESAWAAAMRQDWPKALSRWMRVHDADPDRLDARLGVARALHLLGRFDDAEVLVAASLERHPDNVDLLIEHVWIAAGRPDWPRAAERFARARRAAPDPAYVEHALRGIAEQLATAATPQAPGASRGQSEPASESEAGEISPSALMLSFESLGERCDFGVVQRHFGVEPLGLLRFAWTGLDALLAALEDRFDAVGSLQDTEFCRYGGETILRMKKYGLIFHTFVDGLDAASVEKQEVFYEEQRRRLSLLKNKLIADLESPQKIYVYASNEAAGDEHVRRLFAALRVYGRNSLLYVRPATARRPEGLVEALGDGLYAGYFPGLNDFESGKSPPPELWRRLCAQTHRLAHAASMGNPSVGDLRSTG